MPKPVLQKVVNQVQYWLLKLNIKPKAVGLQFKDWVALSEEIGQPGVPVYELNGIRVILIDGDDGKVKLFEHLHPRDKVKRDH